MSIMSSTIPLVINPSDYTKLQEAYDLLTTKYLKLEHELQWLKRQLFGKKSERFIPNDKQLSLDLDVPFEDVEIQKEEITYTRNKVKKQNGHSRGIMPTHLPFDDTIIEPKEDVSGLKKIGEEITWEYEYTPGSLIIHRYIRPKYERKDQDGITIGQLPSRPIEKGNFGPGFMAQVSVDKYLYHMPLYRQIQRFNRHYGVLFSESTFVDIISKTAFWLESVYVLFKKKVLQSNYIMADETPIPVLIKLSKKKMHKGYYWVYYDPLSKVVVFDFQKTRSRDGPNSFLKDFKGILQIDGYAGYNDVVSREEVIRAACMAHVRRGFDKSLGYNETKAKYALNQIKDWFAVEKESREDNLSYEERLTIRKDSLVESFEEFKKWMIQQIGEETPQSPIRKACNYGLGQWDGFKPFLTDGRVELSNNLVENIIRPVTLGRKNYLFKGSENGAKRGAIIYSIIATAKLHDLDPLQYIKMLLKELPNTKSNDIGKFMPDILK